MARIEASLSPRLKRSRLTCFECGRIAKVDLKGGFCDEEFQQANGFRRCLDCQCKESAKGMLNSFHVRRKAFYWCRGCKEFRPEALAIREKNARSHYSGDTLGLVLAEFRKQSCGDDKLCAFCYNCASAMALGRHLENERKENFGLFKVEAK